LKKLIIFLFAPTIVFTLIFIFLLKTEPSSIEATQKSPNVIHDEYLAESVNTATENAPVNSKVSPLVIKQTDDYLTVALQLLHKAREGDGASQFELVELLSTCSGAIDVLDSGPQSSRDQANELLSYPLSVGEKDMLSQFLNGLDNCANFRGGGFAQFNDGETKANGVHDAFIYWLRKSLSNGVRRSAIILLGADASGAVTLTDEERSIATKILREVIQNPAAEDIFWLNQFFQSSEYFSAPAINWKFSRHLDTHGDIHKNLNPNLINCLRDKYIALKFSDSQIDCAENVKIYGRWYDPEHSSKIEEEAKRIHDAWQSGDYARAGYGGLPHFLSESSN